MICRHSNFILDAQVVCTSKEHDLYFTMLQTVVLATICTKTSNDLNLGNLSSKRTNGNQALHKLAAKIQAASKILSSSRDQMAESGQDTE